jgi:tRNA(Ile)-lysidine synthase
MLEAFKKHIAGAYPELEKKSLLIACSGGLDSVVLFHLCDQMGYNFSVAHCNFGLRAQESDADEEFVRSLCKSSGMTCHITHFDTLGYMNKHGLSVQVAARKLRYHWFSELMDQHGIDLLLTAHHADDALETFLINLSRGTGLEGLRGIPAKTETLFRPLLPFTRAEIEAYARTKDLQWREDSTNLDTRYLRNKIRLELLPVLKELHPAFMENFLNTQAHMAGSARIINQYAQLLKEKWFSESGGPVRIPVDPIAQLQPRKDYLYLLFSGYGFADGGEIEDLLVAGSGKFRCSATHRLLKDRDHLLLEEIKEKDNSTHTFSPDTVVLEEPIVLKLNEVSSIQTTSPHILYVDKETLNNVLTLRKWRKGDYFYPLGMKGKKKVSKFFKDEKMDIIAKENQWLLCSGGNIVWIIGKRADDRYKLTDRTKEILKLILE